MLHLFPLHIRNVLPLFRPKDLFLLEGSVLELKPETSSMRETQTQRPSPLDTKRHV